VADAPAPIEINRLGVTEPSGSDRVRKLITRATKRASAMIQERQPFLYHWRDISRFMDPRRGQFLWGKKKGAKEHQSIVNNRAFKSAKVMGAGFQSGNTSRSRPWFRMTTLVPGADKTHEAALWLSAVVDLLREVFDRSNFYETTRVSYRELGEFGVMAFSMLRDFDDVLRCRQHEIGSYCMGVDYRGTPDTFYEEFVLTVSQMADRYDYDNLSTAIQNKIDKGESLDETVMVKRMIEPNRGDDFVQGARGWRGAPFRMLDWDGGDPDNKALALEPFDYFPVVYVRWEPSTEHAYSVTWPGAEALGDIKQMQSYEEGLAKMAELIWDPSLVATAQLRGQLAGPPDPGDMLYVDSFQGQEQVRRVFELNPQIAELVALIEKIEMRVASAFHEDVFKAISMIERGNVREQEILARIREQMMELGPVVEGLNDQLNDPAIGIAYALCESAGLVPPLPPVLEGMPLKPDYISVLAQSQKSVDISQLDQQLMVTSAAIEVDPSARHRFNGDGFLVEYFHKLGVSPSTIHSDEEVEAAVEAEQQAIARQQAVEMAKMGADAAKSASGASMEGDTMLSRMGNQQPQPSRGELN